MTERGMFEHISGELLEIKSRINTFESVNEVQHNSILQIVKHSSDLLTQTIDSHKRDIEEQGSDISKIKTEFSYAKGAIGIIGVLSAIFTIIAIF